MVAFFRYVLMLAAFLLPIFFLYKEENQFICMFGVFCGVTCGYWLGHFILRRKIKKQKQKENNK